MQGFGSFQLPKTFLASSLETDHVLALLPVDGRGNAMLGCELQRLDDT